MNKKLFFLLCGQLVSILGGNIIRFIFSLYVLKETGSAALFSVVLSLSILPNILFMPISGYIADRFDKKKMIVGLDFVTLLLILFTSVIVKLNLLSVSIVLLMTVILSVITSFMTPVVQTTIPRIVDEHELFQANGMSAMINGISNFLGPVIAGIFFTTLDLFSIMISIVIIYVIATFIELLLKFDSEARCVDNDFISSMQGVIKYTKRNGFILIIVRMASMINLLIAPLLLVGLPILIIQFLKLNEIYYAFSQGAIAFSMLLAGGLSGVVLRNKKPLKVTCNNLMSISISLILLAVIGFIIKDNISIYVVTTLVCSYIMYKITLISIRLITYIQERVDDEYMGKIMSFLYVVSTVFIPIGQVLYGIVFDSYIELIFYIILIIGLLVMGSAIYYRKINM